jgi:hypothetical protein
MNEPTPEPRRKRWGRWCITAFILVHLYIMVFWGLPGSKFRNYMVDPVQDYVLKCGLWHSWDMFSPDPLSMNFSLHAQVFFQDGSLKIWEFPRMEKLGYFERYQKERYRKWRERVRQDVYSSLWDDTARYIARLHNNPTNPPVKIVLVRQWESIPPLQFKPGTFIYKPYQPMPKNFDDLKYSFRFKFYDVRPGDL